MQAQPNRNQRIQKRVPCAVAVGRRRYAGVVLNVSQSGLFIQTGASAERGSRVDLELSASERPGAIPVRARVVWRRQTPLQLRSVVGSGMGVHIENADESYYQLLARWMRLELGDDEPLREPAAGQIFRVLVRERSGPRCRALTVEAKTLEEAREAALQHAGEGWRAVDVQPV